jgi:RNA-directed DNA polymerase
LHQWARADEGRVFDDVFNLVHDPAFLVAGWDRVRGNKGGRTAGVDGIAPRSLLHGQAVEVLTEIRRQVKAGEFRPLPVRERRIPKSNGKTRSLGIPTLADRVVQASLKLVLEPIFEADFSPSSYGFRPRRRAQDAIAEIHKFTSRPLNYEWVFEADITACFDEIDHTALMRRIRERITDKRVLTLVRRFLKAGILSEDGVHRNTHTGTPQGGILSPLLANIALSGLDDHFQKKWASLGPSWTRAKLRRTGIPVMKLIRYADDFVVLVHGSVEHVQALWDEVAEVLAPMGLRLSVEKTKVTHIDQGFDFLGWRIQRRMKRGTSGQARVYTYPSKKSLASIKERIRGLTRRAQHRTLADLLRRVNPVLRAPTCTRSPGGSTSRSSPTCSTARSSAGRYRGRCIPSWLSMPCRWASTSVNVLVTTCPGWCITRTAGSSIERFAMARPSPNKTPSHLSDREAIRTITLSLRP